MKCSIVDIRNPYVNFSRNSVFIAGDFEFALQNIDQINVYQFWGFLSNYTRLAVNSETTKYQPLILNCDTAARITSFAEALYSISKDSLAWGQLYIYTSLTSVMSFVILHLTLKYDFVKVKFL